MYVKIDVGGGSVCFRLLKLFPNFPSSQLEECYMCVEKMEGNINKILDVSWRFGVTAASNDSDNVAKSFLQLKLCFDDNGKVKNVFTEMTIVQFYKFLHDLEKAKCNLDLLL